jgi:hypothetical protein
MHFMCRDEAATEGGGEGVTMEIKKMLIDVNDIQRGDLVMACDNESCYFVLDIGKTVLHSHPFIRVVYGDGERRRWYLHMLELDARKRIVYRLMPSSQKGSGK